MGAVTVNQISITQLKQIDVLGGDVMHALKSSDFGYAGFGEAYFSMIKNGFIKPWKRHLKMTLNLVVPVGQVEFVFCDEIGSFREEIIGADRYIRITVPPGIWFAFKGLASPYSLLMNIANITHDSNEIQRKELSDFKYKWK